VVTTTIIVHKYSVYVTLLKGNSC